MNLPHACSLMRTMIDDERVPVSYLPRFREFAIETSTTLVVEVFYWCPWCGAKLPESLRDELGDRLEALGLNIFDENIPEKFRSDQWWRDDL